MRPRVLVELVRAHYVEVVSNEALKQRQPAAPVRRGAKAMTDPLLAGGARLVRILFVDDDDAVLTALVDVCAKEGGFAAAVASDGRDALARIESDLPDVVVSDQRMPVTTGIELFTHLRATRPHIVRVLMTAEPHADISRRALVDGGVHAVIEKPWKLRALIATLRSASAQARAHRVAAAADAVAAVRAFKRSG